MPWEEILNGSTRESASCDSVGSNVLVQVLIEDAKKFLECDMLKKRKRKIEHVPVQRTR